MYQATLPFSSAVCSLTKSFTANLMAFSGVTPMRFARIPLPRTQLPNNKPVETGRTFLSTNGLKAIPRTLILHWSCRLSLFLNSSNQTLLEDESSPYPEDKQSKYPQFQRYHQRQVFEERGPTPSMNLLYTNLFDLIIRHGSWRSNNELVFETWK